MTALRKKKKYTPEKYLALEKAAEYKSEYENGEIVQMAGGTLDHNQITSNVSRFLGNKLPENCRAISSEMKIRVDALNKFYYPDVIAFCGEPQFYQKRKDTIVNPILIVEVLSDSTEAKDRGEKMLAYRTLESLQEYILISQDKPIVEQYTKNAEGNWIHKATIGLKSIVKLESVNVELNLEEIYQRIEFEGENL